MKKLFKRLLLGLVLGAGVYAGGAIYLGVEKLSASLASFSYLLFLPVLGLTFTNYLLRFLKWRLYLRVLGIAVPFGLNLTIFLGGLSMTVTPGKIGELLKAYLLRESQGVPMARSAPIVIAERVTDLLALVLLMGCGFYSFRRFHLVLYSVGGMVALFLIVVSSRRLSLGLLRLIARLPGLSRLGTKLEEFYQSTAELFRPGPLLASTLLSLAAWFCECLGFYLVLGGFPGASAAPLLLAVFIYSATTLGGVVSPGGIGVTDGSMTALLSYTAAFTAATAGAATLLIRLCTLWFAVLVGVLALVIFRKRVGLTGEINVAELKKP